MDRWTQYLFESHNEKTYRNWAKRLHKFRFFRAYGGHANDGDSFDVAYKYQNQTELLSFFDNLGISLIHHSSKPNQPIPGTPYPGDVFEKFPSLIPNTQWLEQAGHCTINEIPAFIWCTEDTIKISVTQSYKVTEEDAINAENIEKQLLKINLEIVDPPFDTKHYICPLYYKEYYD